MDNLCRICLRMLENVTLLTDNIIKKIEAIATIQVVIGASYPTKICRECAKNVNELYNFRKVIIANDKELKEMCAKIKEDTDVQVKSEDSESATDDMDLNESKAFEERCSPTPDCKDLNDEAVETTKFKKTCNECKAEFTSRFKLYNHKRTVHVAKSACHICGLTVRPDNLKRHIMIHNSPPAKCDICGMVSKNAMSLRHHKFYHRKVEFTCEVCGKNFFIKSQYTRHMGRHMGTVSHKKVICDICGKEVVDMKRHMQTHTGARPHVCEYCEKGFTSPYALKVHVRQHTNERPFKCAHCPIAFPQKCSLMLHLKSKHSTS